MTSMYGTTLISDIGRLRTRFLAMARTVAACRRHACGRIAESGTGSVPFAVH